MTNSRLVKSAVADIDEMHDKIDASGLENQALSAVRNCTTIESAVSEFSRVILDFYNQNIAGASDEVREEFAMFVGEGIISPQNREGVEDILDDNGLDPEEFSDALSSLDNILEP